MFTVSSLVLLSLPPSKHRWISAVTVLSNMPKPDSQTTVLCGDRKGSVHVYHCTYEPSKAKEPSTYQEPVQSLRLHGPNGVTSIATHGGYVYTAGRDGCCRRFSLGTDGLLIEISKFKVCILCLMISLLRCILAPSQTLPSWKITCSLKSWEGGLTF